MLQCEMKLHPIWMQFIHICNMTKSLKVVVPSVHMKPSMAYSTEIASQKMENFIHQQYEKSTKKMDDVLNHVMINECPYKCPHHFDFELVYCIPPIQY
jgi:hypothetical protein